MLLYSFKHKEIGVATRWINIYDLIEFICIVV